jgi:hypothetical protein
MHLYICIYTAQRHSIKDSNTYIIGFKSRFRLGELYTPTILTKTGNNFSIFVPTIKTTSTSVLSIFSFALKSYS